MEKNGTQNQRIVAFLRAIGWTIALFAIFFILCAFLLWKTGMSDKTLRICLLAADAAAVFVGGCYLGKRMERKKYLWGIFFGGIIFVIYFVIAFMTKGDSTSIAGMWQSFAAMTIGGMLGGMLS